MQNHKVDFDLIEPEYLKFVLKQLSNMQSISEETYNHLINTAEISMILAEKFNLDEQSKKDLYTASLLHDVGKQKIDFSVLHKSKGYDINDKLIMDYHTIFTREMLHGKVNQRIEDIAFRHHEKLDGSGYPLGLLADELAIEERILTVADITSALVLERCYKSPFNSEKAFTIMNAFAEKGEIDKDIVQCVRNNYLFEGEKPMFHSDDPESYIIEEDQMETSNLNEIEYIQMELEEMEEREELEVLMSKSKKEKMAKTALDILEKEDM